MDYLAFYRKYRPQVFEDVLGQNNIILSIINQIKEGRLSHGYLFCGPRGTGKTSTAKILARALNCEHPRGHNPCNQCYTCQAILNDAFLDVIEMDAASHNGVDDIRSLIDGVKFPPSYGKKKVIIIDEAHMLSKEAFNALLKTLEEPPGYIVFVLATTEVNKLPQTIVSRLLRYDFKRIEPGEMAQHIKAVAGKEGLDITESAALKIAFMADGALRDALGTLEKVASVGLTHIDDKDLADIVGAGEELSLALFSKLMQRDALSVIELALRVYRSGKSLELVLDEITELMRKALVYSAVESQDKSGISDRELSVFQQVGVVKQKLFIIEALEELLGLGKARSFSNQRAAFEYILLKICFKGGMEQEPLPEHEPLPELKTIIEPETRMDGKRELRQSFQLNSEYKPKPEIRPETRLEPVSETRIETNSHADIEPRFERKPETELKPEPTVQTVQEAQSIIQTETYTEHEPVLQADPEIELRSETEGDSAAAADFKLEADTDLQPEYDKEGVSGLEALREDAKAGDYGQQPDDIGDSEITGFDPGMTGSKAQFSEPLEWSSADLTPEPEDPATNTLDGDGIGLSTNGAEKQIEPKEEPAPVKAETLSSRFAGRDPYEGLRSGLEQLKSKYIKKSPEAAEEHLSKSESLPTLDKITREADFTSAEEVRSRAEVQPRVEVQPKMDARPMFEITDSEELRQKWLNIQSEVKKTSAVAASILAKFGLKKYNEDEMLLELDEKFKMLEKSLKFSNLSDIIKDVVFKMDGIRPNISIAVN